MKDGSRFLVRGSFPLIAHNCVQRTGHYVLLGFNKHLEALKRERKLWAVEVPVLCNLHDERICMIKEKNLEMVHSLYAEALARLNDELKPRIKFEMSPEWGHTLYEVKKP